MRGPSQSSGVLRFCTLHCAFSFPLYHNGRTSCSFARFDRERKRGRGEAKRGRVSRERCGHRSGFAGCTLRGHTYEPANGGGAHFSSGGMLHYHEKRPSFTHSTRKAELPVQHTAFSMMPRDSASRPSPMSLMREGSRVDLPVTLLILITVSYTRHVTAALARLRANELVPSRLAAQLRPRVRARHKRAASGAKMRVERTEQLHLLRHSVCGETRGRAPQWWPRSWMRTPSMIVT